MDNNHKSIGPEVGSSRGKNISSFLPTFSGKNQSIKISFARKKLQKTKSLLSNLFCPEKIPKQFQKNSIPFCLSAKVSLLTFMIIVFNLRISENPGKIRKNRNFQFANFSTENKSNSQKFELDKNQSNQRLHDPPPKKNQEKILPSPPISKSQGFLVGKKGEKKISISPPPSREGGG